VSTSPLLRPAKGQDGPRSVQRKKNLPRPPRAANCDPKGWQRTGRVRSRVGDSGGEKKKKNEIFAEKKLKCSKKKSLGITRAKAEVVVYLRKKLQKEAKS